MCEFVLITMVHDTQAIALFYFTLHTQFPPNMPETTKLCTPRSDIFSAIQAHTLNSFWDISTCLSHGHPNLMHLELTASLHLPNPTPLPTEYFKKLLNHPPKAWGCSQILPVFNYRYNSNPVVYTFLIWLKRHPLVSLSSFHFGSDKLDPSILFHKCTANYPVVPLR